MNNLATDNTVSKQWINRPDDERFLSLEELSASVHNRADNSKTQVVDSVGMKAYGTEEGELVLNTPTGPKFFTNWSFGQTASLAGAPGGYLKKLPSPLAALCLNHGFAASQRQKSMLLTNGNESLRAVTSETYGRIWDYQVVEAVQRVTEGGNWKIPAASYASKNPKRATTLYASDRDVFMFLCDDEHPIVINGDQMFRGFYCWNSEVGSQVFGLATFLYRTVCDNRIIWGIANKSEIRIKHTSGAPERFLREGKAALIEYANESDRPIIEQIKRAQDIKVGNDEKEVAEFLKKRGFTLAQANTVIETAKAEEGEYRSPWSLAQGVSANARAIAHTDTRVELEREAGKLLTVTV